MTALPPNRLKTTHPIAAADYFGKNKFRATLTRFFINAILISRKNPTGDNDGNPIQIMIDVVKSGKSIILYPEGSRGVPGVMQPFKKGIGYVVEGNAGVPVIPVYMDGIGRILPKGNKLILPNITKIYFGRPLFFEQESPEEITRIIEFEINQLKEKSIATNNIR